MHGSQRNADDGQAGLSVCVRLCGPGAQQRNLLGVMHMSKFRDFDAAAFFQWFLLASSQANCIVLIHILLKSGPVRKDFLWPRYFSGLEHVSPGSVSRCAVQRYFRVNAHCNDWCCTRTHTQ